MAAKNTYYWNGRSVTEGEAMRKFTAHSPGRYELNQSQLFECWANCQKSEEVRDSYLPDGLEIVQA